VATWGLRRLSTAGHDHFDPVEHHELLPEYDPKALTKLERYRAEHARSVAHPDAYWKSKAEHFLTWDRPFRSVLSGSLRDGDVTWFQGGQLNVCYNAIDRHVEAGKGDRVAMIWEGDEPGDVARFTYGDLQRRVSQIANALLAEGVRKGDVVTIYLPMIPELPMTMLACARIGAVHSVVFAGFSAEALASRISAAESPFVVTAWEGVRGGKSIPLKKIVDEARTKENSDHYIRKVFIFERKYKGADIELQYLDQIKDKDVRMDPLVAVQRPYCPPATVDAEDNLFILYTSGSTGMYA
jgi:acetyl-CoA synthetase